ncbi:diacylglycerol/lipid kinase family protein [Ruminococcus sp.]|uniref:diacylglycerol/lipid kinase family protein n=1 Tax=Ruminococcus sp. TaxID=41978 RepID=UPI003993E407
MKQIYFICNLHSGRASVGSHLAMIIDKFTAAGFQVTVHPTQDRGDATVCAKQACDAGCYDILVCSGGDGTLNEVIQGCMQSETQCPIGYIPFGSTNDFARGLGIPKEPEAAVDCIIHGEDLRCDVGSFNDKYFTYVAAFGAFTEISYETPQQFKNLLGHSAYLLNAISKLPKIRAYRMRIEYDGGVIEDEFLYGMVTNSSSVAKFLALSDSAVGRRLVRGHTDPQALQPGGIPQAGHGVLQDPAGAGETVSPLFPHLTSESHCAGRRAGVLDDRRGIRRHRACQRDRKP